VVVVEELDGFICLATEWMQQLPPQPVRLMMQIGIPEPECLPCEQAISLLGVSALIVSL